jgi:hypothetical protein
MVTSKSRMPAVWQKQQLHVGARVGGISWTDGALWHPEGSPATAVMLLSSLDAASQPASLVLIARFDANGGPGAILQASGLPSSSSPMPALALAVSAPRLLGQGTRSPADVSDGLGHGQYSPSSEADTTGSISKGVHMSGWR